jgi:hypothetical protein
MPTAPAGGLLDDNDSSLFVVSKEASADRQTAEFDYPGAVTRDLRGDLVVDVHDKPFLF